MAPSAAETALALPELLEMVLVHLPARDLLSVQRVSKDFRYRVQSDKRLQENLFYRFAKLCGVDHLCGPSYSSCRFGIDTHMAAILANNKFILAQQKVHAKRTHPMPLNTLFWRDATHQCSAYIVLTASLPIETLSFLHPAITNLGLRRESPAADHVDLYVTLDARIHSSDTAQMAPKHFKASWRKMLVKQCPCTAIRIELTLRKYKCRGITRRKEFPADTTMGELMDWCGSQYAAAVEKYKKYKQYTEQEST